MGDGFNCTDVDECDMDLDNCHEDAYCTNTFGGFNCTCFDGYDGDGVNCTDIDECFEEIDECHDQAECSNFAGGYNCSCIDGFEVFECWTN